jgi:hypothetical protein
VIWEPEETARFLEHVAEDRLAALYELAAYAGLRRAELCGLRWADLDDDLAGLAIRQTLIEVSSKDLRPFAEIDGSPLRPANVTASSVTSWRASCRARNSTPCGTARAR